MSPPTQLDRTGRVIYRLPVNCLNRSKLELRRPAKRI